MGLTDYMPSPTLPPRDEPERSPTRWNGSPDIHPGHGTFHNPAPVTPPPVPKNDGSSGTTTVDTASMEVFARNIEQLIAPVQKASVALKDTTIAPGDFFHAHLMRTKVSGERGNGGVREAYCRVLDDLADGLTNLCSGVRALSREYGKTEDANEMTAKELDEYMYAAGVDFQALGQDSARVGG
jgi:hypothetical protein